jgi:hypothetical protein
MELYQLYQVYIKRTGDDIWQAYIKRTGDGTLWLLLRGHMLELHEKMYKNLCNTEQKNFRLILSPVQALAFVETWNRLDTSAYPLGTVVVARCVQEIDKVVKNSKVYV